MGINLTESDRDAIWESINFWDDEADDLYPVVERLITQARAAALREAADQLLASADYRGSGAHQVSLPVARRSIALWLKGRAHQIQQEVRQ